MSIWGKVLIGSAGFALGGPLGAILGSIVGHGVDKVRDREKKITSSNKGYNAQTIFATGVISLLQESLLHYRNHFFTTGVLSLLQD